MTPGRVPASLGRRPRGPGSVVSHEKSVIVPIAAWSVCRLTGTRTAERQADDFGAHAMADATPDKQSGVAATVPSPLVGRPLRQGRHSIGRGWARASGLILFPGIVLPSRPSTVAAQSAGSPSGSRSGAGVSPADGAASMAAAGRPPGRRVELRDVLEELGPGRRPAGRRRRTARARRRTRSGAGSACLDRAKRRSTAAGRIVRADRRAARSASRRPPGRPPPGRDPGAGGRVRAADSARGGPATTGARAPASGPLQAGAGRRRGRAVPRTRGSRRGRSGIPSRGVSHHVAERAGRCGRSSPDGWHSAARWR